MQKHYYDLRFRVDQEEWRARAKRTLIFRFWEKYALRNRDKIMMLDFGCGSGLTQEEFEKRFANVEAYGIDISKEAINFCKKRNLTRVALFDGINIPFKKNVFHLVTIIDVLEHIKDDIHAINEIKRVLKKGGLGIILVPARQELFSTRDIRLHHVRRYGNGELENKCRKAGLKVISSKNVDFLLYFILLLICKLAKKKKGVPHIRRETAATHPVINEIIYGYELLETKILEYLNFPIGISILTIVKKV